MIKPLLLTLTLALAATPLAAEEIKETCEGQAAMAKLIMKTRQSGLPLTRTLSVIKQDWTRELAIRAYKRPQYPEGYRTKPITDFQDKIYLECLGSMD